MRTDNCDDCFEDRKRNLAQQTVDASEVERTRAQHNSRRLAAGRAAHRGCSVAGALPGGRPGFARFSPEEASLRFVHGDREKGTKARESPREDPRAGPGLICSSCHVLTSWVFRRWIESRTADMAKEPAAVCLRDAMCEVPPARR